MENVITLSKLIGLLLLFCHPPPPPPLSLYYVFENSKNKRNDLARPGMGTIFLVIMNKSQVTTVFSGRQKLTSAMKLRSEK